MQIVGIFLPKTFIADFCNLTCVLSITNRKQLNIGIKPLFRSGFYIFLFFLRPSCNSSSRFTIFSDGNRYSYELFHDLCWRMRGWCCTIRYQRQKMSENESVKKERGRPKSLTSSAKKRKKSANDAKWNKSRINIGGEFGRWNHLKELHQLKTHAEVATILLDR